MSDGTRTRIPIEAAAAVLAFAVGLVTLNPLPVGGFYDDALYTILAKSLATGQGYRFLNLPGAPAAVHYPPGYPLLLALFWKLDPAFPGNVVWFKLLNIVLLAVVAWAIYRYAVRVLELSPGVAFLGTALGTITIPILVLTNMLLSEPFFLALLVPALILGEQAAKREPTRGQAIGLGALSAAVVLIRSIGIMLILAVAIVWLVRRHRRAAAWYVGSAVVILAPWQLWSAMHAAAVVPVLRGSYGSYLAWFMGGVHTGGLPFLVATARVNVLTLAGGVATSFRYGPWVPVALLTLVLVVLLLAYGAWRARRHSPVTLVFLALYFALVIVWPDQPLRFAWGVWPLLMLLLVLPLEVLQQADVPSALRAGVGVAALLLVPGLLRYNVSGYRGRWWASIPRSMTARAQPVVSWVRAHTGPHDVVAAESEPIVYLYTGRQAVPVAPFTAVQYLRRRTTAQNADALRQILHATGAHYVVMQAPAEVNAARALAADSTASPRLALTDSAPGLMVFATVAPGADSAPARPSAR